VRTRTRSTEPSNDRRDQCCVRLCRSWVARVPVPLERRVVQASADRARIARRDPRRSADRRLVAPMAPCPDRRSTGRATGLVVLDVDTKGEVDGFHTLAELGFAILPDTPMVHTTSGGLHLYFRAADYPEIRNTAGAKGRGIGPGLDWRGEGGYVIVPSPGSGYYWDSHWNVDTAQLTLVPSALLPREPRQPIATTRLVRPTAGLSPYAEAALLCACRAIVAAPAGEQELTIVREAFSLGTLAGAGGAPRDFARRALQAAAGRVRDHDPRRPWRAREIEIKVNRAFDAGLDHPRGARRHG
jgi:hypothetical protein